jgi:pentatricopeptide repeat protein
VAVELSLPKNKPVKTGIPISKHKRQLRKSIDVRVPDIHAIKDSGSCEQALKHLRDMGSDASISAYHAAIDVCLRKKQPNLARLVLCRMRNAGAVPSLIIYSKVMSSYSKLGR